MGFVLELGLGKIGVRVRVVGVRVRIETHCNFLKTNKRVTLFHSKR